MLITAGEYSRLYRYEDCEAEAWTLAYKLASEIDDYCTIIYGMFITIINKTNYSTSLSVSYNKLI